MNLQVFIVSLDTQSVCGSIIEVEYWAVYINAKQSNEVRSTSKKMNPSMLMLKG